MQHLNILLSFLSIVVGVLAFSSLLFHYYKNENIVLKYFLYFFGTFYFFSLMTILSLYLEANLPEILNNNLRAYFVVMVFNVSFLIYSIILFYQNLFSIEKKIQYIAYFFLSAGVVYTVLQFFLFRNDQSFIIVTDWILRILSVFIIIFFIAITVTPKWHIQRIENNSVKKWFKTGLALIILFLIFHLGSQFLDAFYFMESIFKNSYFSFFFLLISIVTIYFSVKYYQEKYMTELYAGVEVSDTFVKKYRISARETEIIIHVISGKTNREIARELDLTEGTVKVLIHQLYKKVQVNNRMALFYLLRSES